MSCLASGMHPAQLRERPRRRPHVLDEQPTKLPRADPETRREVFGRHLIQRPALNQPQRPHYRARAAAPGREVRGHFRSTAKAGSKSRFLGPTPPTDVETDVALSGRRGRADRTAIDAGRANAHENTSVKPPVAGQKYPIAGVVIESHGECLTHRCGTAGGFRTSSSKRQFARLLTPHRIDRPDELTSGISSPGSGATSGALSRIARAASTLARARAARSRLIFSPHFVLGGGHLGLLHQVVGEMGASRSRYSFGSVVAGWCFRTLTRPWYPPAILFAGLIVILAESALRLAWAASSKNQ